MEQNVPPHCCDKQKSGSPETGHPPCILSLNFTSLLTFVKKFLLPLCQFFLPLFARIEFLDFRHKESMMDCGSSISYGFWRFSGVAMAYCPSSKPSWLNSVLLTLLPGYTKPTNSGTMFSRGADGFPAFSFSHRTPSPSLPIRDFHQKTRTK